MRFGAALWLKHVAGPCGQWEPRKVPGSGRLMPRSSVPTQAALEEFCAALEEPARDTLQRRTS